MDYRTGILATRALVDGEQALVSTIEGLPAFDGAAFARFARRQHLREWFAPAASHPRFRRHLPAEFAADLDARWAARGARRDALLDLCVTVRDALGAVGVPSLLLKGLTFGQRFYAAVDRRSQHDVDVLVRIPDLVAALDALAALGFRPEASESVERLERKLPRIRGGDAKNPPQAVTLRRAGGIQLDLHCRLKSRLYGGIVEEALWPERRDVCIAGHVFETLSDDHTLMFLLASIGSDIRRGRSRAKHFLDLYFVLRTLAADLDWDRFFADRERQALGAVSASVLAVFLAVWPTARELPTLVDALRRHRRLVELRDEEQALSLVSPSPRRAANERWFRRLRTRRGASERAWHLGVDLRHTLTRRFAPRWLPPPVTPVELPPALATLLQREGLRAVRVDEIGALSGDALPRRSFRIELEDGRTVKGRTLRDARVPERMRRWLREAPPARFPALLATHDHASLEAWDPGPPCIAPGDDVVAEAGALLARLHVALDVEEVSAEDPRFAAWLESSDLAVRRLADAGWLVREEAETLERLLRERRPGRARFGLRHGDFCAENLVCGEKGLVCIDNTTLRPGLLERDLAQTFYRWPLTGIRQRAFLGGYRAHACPDLFLEARPFWMALATLRAADFRLRHGVPGIGIPLEVLRRHVR